MPCASDDDLAIGHHEVKDFTRSHPYTPTGILAPENRRGLVRAVLMAEARGAKAKAIGANYSLSRAQVSDGFVIETTRLDRQLSRPFPATPDGTIAPGRFRSGFDADHLARMVRPGVSLGRNHLVHVEAGIHLKDLLADLDGLGLALPTMGAGGQQTLAGALATATHGSDIDRPPLADFVRAIHLVGPGGQEWWIEPAFGVVRAPDATWGDRWCPETLIVRDDELFRAALVSVGRFGVIYALVLEVEPQYWLHDRNDKQPWSDVRAALGRCARDGNYDVDGVFRRSNGDRVRYYSVVVDLAHATQCWVNRRWVTTDHTDLGLGDQDGSDSFLCCDSGPLVAAVLAMKPLFTALEGQALAIPFVGLVWGPRIIAVWIELMDKAHTSKTIGDFLVRAFAMAAALPESEVGPAAYAEIRLIIRKLGEDALAGQMVEERRGRSGRILDTHNYKADHCYNGTSAEFFFNADDAAYLEFVDKVVQAGAHSSLGPVAGYLSLRYVQGSHALLAMQRWRRSVAVEVAVGRRSEDGAGDMFADFVSAVHADAKAAGAIPHWGQVHTSNPALLESAFGRSLESWRWALAEIQTRGGATFSSAFCHNRGLDPEKTVDTYRGPRSAGVLVSSLVPMMF